MIYLYLNFKIFIYFLIFFFVICLCFFGYLFIIMLKFFLCGFCMVDKMLCLYVRIFFFGLIEGSRLIKLFGEKLSFKVIILCFFERDLVSVRVIVVLLMLFFGLNIEISIFLFFFLLFLDNNCVIFVF